MTSKMPHIVSQVKKRCSFYLLNVIVLLAFCSETISLGIFDITLPDILSGGGNSTILSEKITIPMKIAILITLTRIPTVLLGAAIGYSVSKVDSKMTLSFGFFLQALSNLIVAARAEFTFLCLSSVVKGCGLVLNSISGIDLIGKLHRNEVVRGRVIVVTTLMALLGYNMGYFLGSSVYVSCGVGVAFLIPCLFETGIMLSVLPFLCCVQDNYEEERHLITGLEDPSSGEEDDRGYMSLLTNFPFIVIVSQTFVSYAGQAASSTITPYMLQQKVGLTISDNGLAYNLAGIVNASTLIILIIVTDSRRKRYAAMSVVLALEAAGMAAYPHARTVWTAAVCETLVIVPKNVVFALSGSLVMDVVDRNRVGTYARATAAVWIARRIGQVSSNLGAGFVVEMIGFSATFYVLATALVLAFFMSFCMVKRL